MQNNLLNQQAPSLKTREEASPCHKFEKGVFRKKFTFNDDILLLKGFLKFGFKWDKIASLFNFSDKFGASKLKNRYYTWHVKPKMFNALSHILKDIEKKVRNLKKYRQL